MGNRKSPRVSDTSLSKSRFAAGLQCEKRLWWHVHEPDELVDDPSLSHVLERGRLIGEAAREFLGGGELIDLPYHHFGERVEATQKAMAAGAPFIYEASFAADGVFVSVDILERRKRGWSLVEVKSSLDVHEHYISDVAIQLYVLERSGIDVKRVEVMHINRDCRHPDLSNLFVKADVTADARKTAKVVPRLIRRFSKVLAGRLPRIEIGDHCHAPYACPFSDRCWPEAPEHHLRTIYRINSKTLASLLDDGLELIRDLPRDFKAGAIASRQIRSVRTRKLVVEPGLGAALATIQGPIAFLDFETISPAIPAWPGCGPYDQVPVQFSCQVLTPSGVSRHAWIADGMEDPRPVFARELVAACEGAATILAYNAAFEKGRIADVCESVPDLAPQLSGIQSRIQDLLPIVRNFVYHPDFGGSFSIKRVLPALIPELGYDDLEIQNGAAAAAVLETFLFDRKATAAAKMTLRKQLLAYCERDTQAMVKLYERLKELSA